VQLAVTPQLIEQSFEPPQDWVQPEVHSVTWQTFAPLQVTWQLLPGHETRHSLAVPQDTLHPPFGQA
jgi:hypothetical protein